jgi:hypothetical protein
VTERRALHYETMAVVAAALAVEAEWTDEADKALLRAVDAYRAAEAALLKAEAT